MITERPSSEGKLRCQHLLPTEERHATYWQSSQHTIGVHGHLDEFLIMYLLTTNLEDGDFPSCPLPGCYHPGVAGLRRGKIHGDGFKLTRAILVRRERSHITVGQECCRLEGCLVHSRLELRQGVPGSVQQVPTALDIAQKQFFFNMGNL
jgi:hypothetical protein